MRLPQPPSPGSWSSAFLRPEEPGRWSGMTGAASAPRGRWAGGESDKGLSSLAVRASLHQNKTCCIHDYNLLELGCRVTTEGMEMNASMDFLNRISVIICIVALVSIAINFARVLS